MTFWKIFLDNFFLCRISTDLCEQTAVIVLTRCMLCKKNNRRHLDRFFLFLLENRIWHLMQIVSLGDNLHETSYPIFYEKEDKDHQFVVCWIRP